MPKGLKRTILKGVTKATGGIKGRKKVKAAAAKGKAAYESGKRKARVAKAGAGKKLGMKGRATARKTVRYGAAAAGGAAAGYAAGRSRRRRR